MLDIRQATLPHDPLERYDSLVASGDLRFDAQQQQVAARLSELASKLAQHQTEMDKFQEKLDRWLAERQTHRVKLIEQEREEQARRRARDQRSPKKDNFIAAWFRQRRRDKELGVGRAVARLNRERALDAQMGPKPVPPKAPEGVYLYGSVGCGKTLLMDMLFAATDGVVKSRRRMHFHAAMLEVNSRMHQLERQREMRQFEKRRAAAQALERGEREEDTWLDDHDDDFKNIVDLVADEYMGVKDEAGLLLICFDEVQVTDPFTAIVLGGLLERLLARGAVVVATSNKAPRELNQYGMQGELFEKFVQRLEHNCEILRVGTGVDYRRVLASAAGDLVGRQEAGYLWPITPASQARLESEWRQLISTVPPQSQQEGGTFVPVMFGRSLYVPHSYGGVARFAFPELCAQPVGAADYIALCQRYHTVVITDVPQMSMRIRDQARRFITLVDELYNHRCRLLCTAAAPPDELFLGQEEGSLMDPELLDLESLQFETEAEGSRLRRDVMVAAGLAPLGGGEAGKKMMDAQLSGREEQFAFKRAVSRLLEMQTPGYLQSRLRSS